MSVTIRWRVHRLLQNQFVLFLLELILLLLPVIGTLFSLPLLQTFSIFFTAPVVVCLAAVWSYFEYARTNQQPIAHTVAQLEDLIEDFGRTNFQASPTGEDSRIIRLLSLASISDDRNASPQPVAQKVASIKETYNTFQLWHLTLRDMVRVLGRRSAILAHDLVDTVNYYIEFYNLYISSIVRATLSLISQEDLEASPSRETFNLYRENMAQLRGRTNHFLKRLADQGLLISGVEVKPVPLGNS